VRGHSEGGSPRPADAGGGGAGGGAERAEGGRRNFMIRGFSRFSKKIEMIFHQYPEYTDLHQTLSK
jgi:hypothetical protein